MSEDPYRSDKKYNFYTYVENNPLVGIDPLGLAVFYLTPRLANFQIMAHLEGLSQFSGNDIWVTSTQRTDNPKSQHYKGNAADFYMTDKKGLIVHMETAARLAADYGQWGGIGYYNGLGERLPHVHVDLRKSTDGRPLYWSETDATGYKYNSNSPLWHEYLMNKSRTKSKSAR